MQTVCRPAEDQDLGRDAVGRTWILLGSPNISSVAQVDPEEREQARSNSRFSWLLKCHMKRPVGLAPGSWLTWLALVVLGIFKQTRFPFPQN